MTEERARGRARTFVRFNPGLETCPCQLALSTRKLPRHHTTALLTPTELKYEIIILYSRTGSEVCSAWFCTQHLPVWVRAPAGLWVAPFVQSFKVCFKLPHATYLTTRAVAFWLFRWGLVVRWKEHTPLSLSHPFWIWSRVSLNMEPLRENQSDKPRLLVAQPRAPAGRRAHATNCRLT